MNDQQYQDWYRATGIQARNADQMSRTLLEDLIIQAEDCGLTAEAAGDIPTRHAADEVIEYLLDFWHSRFDEEG